MIPYNVLLEYIKHYHKYDYNSYKKLIETRPAKFKYRKTKKGIQSWDWNRREWFYILNWSCCELDLRPFMELHIKRMKYRKTFEELIND